MPMYNLLFRTNGVLGPTNVQLQVSGTSANYLQVQARTTGTPPGPWTPVLNAHFTSQNGQSSPNNPANGDTLQLPTQVLTVSNITGRGTFAQNGEGSNGPGYYTDKGPAEEEGDWCAASG